MRGELKMAPFAAVAPGGKVQCAMRGARVDGHIRAGYHADAGARCTLGKSIGDALGRRTHAPF